VNNSNGNRLDKHKHKIDYEITLIALLVIIIVGVAHNFVVTC